MLSSSICKKIFASDSQLQGLLKLGAESSGGKKGECGCMCLSVFNGQSRGREG